jgi:hypothetical protein
LITRSRTLAALFLVFTRTGGAVDLRPETIDAFNKFIESAEARLEPRFSGRMLLWSDQVPAVRQQLLNGLVIAQPVQGNGIVPLKGGLVQDWQGAAFHPHATLRHVISIVQDYCDHHRDFYKPDIADAKVESATETSSWFSCGSSRRNSYSPLYSTRST